MNAEADLFARFAQAVGVDFSSLCGMHGTCPRLGSFAAWHYYGVTPSSRRPALIDRAGISAVLVSRGTDTSLVDAIISALPWRAHAVVLYGSVARGDSSDNSDIDLLVVSDEPDRTKAKGRVNVSTYDEAQFSSARGTLFGMHVARDGIVLHDEMRLQDLLADFHDVDLENVFKRLRGLAELLALPDDEVSLHLPGFVRHARYVLRTATYARALKMGQPCFSVSELATRFGDPELRTLLSSHRSVQGNPTMSAFRDLRDRIVVELEVNPTTEYKKLGDAIVGYGVTFPEVADAGILILNQDSSDPYALIPRVIL